MPRTRRYKKVEKNIVHSISVFFKGVFGVIGNAVCRFFRAGRRKLTIMVVPHSQEKVINFQTNIFAVCAGVLLIVGIVSSFFWFNRKSADSSAQIARLETENRETRASLDQLRDENTNLLRAAQKFQNSLNQTLSLLGISETETDKTAARNGDLSSLFSTQEISQGAVRETSDIRQLTSYLESSVRPIEAIGQLMESQGALFSDIPSLWPLKGGIGHISMLFGQNIHPLTGLWYIHKGMDISTWRSGDPIIATANGQVVTVSFDPGFGNYVIIKHKHGFYTRYAHMNSIRVQRGQYVSQGQVIGTIGNTGISTGPHLHYEVHIGSDVVDPAKYVNIKMTK